MSDYLSLFIVGLPRSGTKLLRELLNNHNKIFIPSIEAYFIPHLVERYGNEKLSKDQVVEVIEEIRNSLFFFYYSQKKSFGFEQFISLNKTVKEIIGEIWYELATKHDKKSAKILGDKTPRNVYRLSFLLNSFPEAKFIHIVRDPRDNVLSARNKWGKNIYRAAFKWQQGINNIEKIDNRSDRLIEVTYEDLLRDTETVLRKLCVFIGIDYQEGMDKLHAKVEKKGGRIDRKNYNKYRTELETSEVRGIEELTKKGLQNYGYTLENSKIQFEDLPPNYMLLFWKLQDVVNLVLFNIQEYGLTRGLKKIIKARKHA